MLLGVVVIVAIFAGVIPQFASYHGAWVALVKMSPGWAVAITAAVINLLVPVWPFQAVLPHLRFRRGFMQIQASTAVATTVPAGGALALGLTYRMFGSFGFSNVAVSTAVVTTGVWNLGFKFGLPIVAVVLLAVTGQGTGRAVGAALIGVALIAAFGIVLWLVFRDEASARWVGRLGDRILNPGRPGQRGRRLHRHADRIRGDIQPCPGRRPGVAGHHLLPADRHRHRDLPALETRPG